jgi:hypothetical protein
LLRHVITPDEIILKAKRAYPKMLGAWVHGNVPSFFPWRVPADLAPRTGDISATISAVEQLRTSSKEVQGTGYTVQWRQIRSRDFGTNLFPERITVETVDDLVALAGTAQHFSTTCRVAQRVRERLPGLADWVTANIRTLANSADDLDGLLQVTVFFLEHPWPDCYARQIPVAVDTKFVEQHQAILRQWLDLLLPGSAIQSDETKFALRFGLRDGQPYTTIRTLDPELQRQIGFTFDELSLPLRTLETLPLRGATVVIVENQLNLLTLPSMPRTLAMRGEGRAVTRLRRLHWLAANRVLYWGDIDVEGFQILSSLRMLFPHVESILMDESVLREHPQLVLAGCGSKHLEPKNLLPMEQAAFRQCLRYNRRLEQEHLPQWYVDHILSSSIQSREA